MAVALKLNTKQIPLEKLMFHKTTKKKRDSVDGESGGGRREKEKGTKPEENRIGC